MVSRCLETYLRCFAFGQPRKGATWIWWAEYWYNTSFHSSLGCSSFKVLYGRDPPPLVGYTKGSTTVLEVESMLEERDAFLDD